MPRLNNTAQAQTEERDGRSKPRTIIRMLSTKFKPPSVPTLRSPPSAPSAYSKEQRDAALRARGLLPRLPNKDLSVQEQEQDRFIPVVAVVDSEKQADVASHPSAADLIKKEWVAKNITGDSSLQQQQNQMKDFKFGGGSPALEVEESRSSRADQAVSPTKSELTPLSTASESGSSPSSSRESVQPPRSSIPTMARPSSLLGEISEEIQAFMFPLPPSPSSSSLAPSPSQRELNAPSTPQSASQQSTSSPHHPNDDTSGGGGSGSGTSTPRPPTKCAIVSETSVASDAPPATAEPPALLRAGNRDSCSGQTEESHSDASIMTPSLDSTSQTTSSSSSHGPASLSAAVPGRKGGLHIKTANREGELSEPDTNAVAVVVASPTANPMAEHRFSEELGVVMEEESRPPSPSPLDSTELGVKFKAEQRDARSPAVNTHSVSSGTDMDKIAAVKIKTVERKRSMNPFKRAGTAAANENANDESPTPRRRLTVATSFSMSNIRRSVVGSLSGRPSSKSPSSAGPRSAPMRGKTFDASHLPPSPTSPFSAGARASTISTSFKSVSSGGRTTPMSPVSPTPRMRQPVVMYNRGSIILEAAGIEDEESRRMTELAFLG